MYKHFIWKTKAFRARLCRFKIKVITSKVLRSLSWTCRPMCCVILPEDARDLSVHLVHAPILWWSPGCSFTLSFLCVFFRFLFVLCCFCLHFLASSFSLDFWVLNISLTVVSLKFIFKIEVSNQGRIQRGAHPARATPPPPPPPRNTPHIFAPPSAIGKIWFFCVKSWFFTRSIPKMLAPPSARRNFFWVRPP